MFGGGRPRLSGAAAERLEERLRSHVDVLAGLIGPRCTRKPKQLAAAAAYIERQLTEIGDTVTRETYAVDGCDVANLIVERRGSRAPEQIVILGAHYDSLLITPGADDNASAVAMLIEVARLSFATPTRRTVRFVAFPCEEMPHFHTGMMGSQRYARGCRERDEQIVGMLCLEMVGYYTDKAHSQLAPDAIPRAIRWFLPTRGDFLAAVANPRSFRLLWRFRRGFKRARSGMRLFSIALPEWIQEIRRSDNSSFWDQNYPALMITDTSFLRNPHYHQPTDTPETLDYPRLALATVGVAGGLAHLAR